MMLSAARRRCRSCARLTSAFLLLLVLGIIPSRLAAHGLPPLPLALWGPFGAPTVHCMRMLSHAAQQCFREVLAANRVCGENQLRGLGCDAEQRAAQLAAAQQKAEAAVDTCFGGQLLELRFTNALDAKTDVRLACTEAALAFDMIYQPLNFVPAPSNTTAAERACISHTAEMSAKLLGFILRAKTRVLDAVGMQVLTPSQKIALLSRASQRIAAASDKLAAHIAATCPGFARRYGRDPSAYFDAIERRSDCLLGLIYYQTSIDCPLPVCGDGIREGSEECDDANGIDADGCRSDCSAS